MLRCFARGLGGGFHCSASFSREGTWRAQAGIVRIVDLILATFGFVQKSAIIQLILRCVARDLGGGFHCSARFSRDGTCRAQAAIVDVILPTFGFSKNPA